MYTALRALTKLIFYPNLSKENPTASSMMHQHTLVESLIEEATYKGNGFF